MSSTNPNFIMAAIPNFETLLLEIRKSLGLKNRYSTDKNEDFRDHGLLLTTHRAMMAAELDAIFEALEMDPAARRDVSFNILSWVNFNQALARISGPARRARNRLYGT
jgi:hypothetical protein